ATYRGNIARIGARDFPRDLLLEAVVALDRIGNRAGEQGERRDDRAAIGRQFYRIHLVEVRTYRHRTAAHQGESVPMETTLLAEGRAVAGAGIGTIIGPKNLALARVCGPE